MSLRCAGETTTFDSIYFPQRGEILESPNCAARRGECGLITRGESQATLFDKIRSLPHRPGLVRQSNLFPTSCASLYGILLCKSPFLLGDWLERSDPWSTGRPAQDPARPASLPGTVNGTATKRLSISLRSSMCLRPSMGLRQSTLGRPH